MNKNMTDFLYSKVFREILDWAVWLVSAVLIALLLSRFVIINSDVPTGSMTSTINAGDRVFGFRLSYLLSEPKRGDIVIFHLPDDEEKLYVKRLIGLPGETVKVVQGVVYIGHKNDEGELDYKKLDEPYIYSLDMGDYGPYNIPEGSYFFMGDNRASSLDARYWTNKYVSRDKLVGKVIFKYYKSFSFFGRPDYNLNWD